MPFRRILVPLDGSALAESGLAHARLIAKCFDASLWLLRVLDDDGSTSSESIDWRLRKIEALRYLEDLAGRMQHEGIPVDWYVSEGRPADQIREFISEHRIELMVLSAWGTGGESEFPLGGTAQKIVSNCEISYFIVGRDGSVPRTGEFAYRRVLIPLDGSQRAEWAVAVVSAMARQNVAEVILLQVVETPRMPRRRPLTAEESSLRESMIRCNCIAAAECLDQVRASLAEVKTVRSRLEVSAHVVNGINQVAEEEDVDLVVMMAQGRSGTNGWSHESICTPVLARCRRPVLVLRDLPEMAAGMPAQHEVDIGQRKLCTR